MKPPQTTRTKKEMRKKNREPPHIILWVALGAAWMIMSRYAFSTPINTYVGAFGFVILIYGHVVNYLFYKKHPLEDQRRKNQFD